MFNEFSEEAETLEKWFEGALRLTSDLWDVSFKHPIPELAKALLNEIVEFESTEEIRRSSLKPWEGR